MVLIDCLVRLQALVIYIEVISEAVDTYWRPKAINLSRKPFYGQVIFFPLQKEANVAFLLLHLTFYLESHLELSVKKPEVSNPSGYIYVPKKSMSTIYQRHFFSCSNSWAKILGHAFVYILHNVNKRGTARPGSTHCGTHRTLQNKFRAFFQLGKKNERLVY